MIRRLNPLWQWAAILALSAASVFLLQQAAVPAAFLIGSMVPAIAFGANGASIRVPTPLYFSVQAVIGCLVARGITPAILAFLLRHWPIVLLVIGTTILASTIVAALLVRFGKMPGTTAVWGSSPGAAGAMILMAEEFGADARLVALMQYIRVVFVVVTASLVSRLWLDHFPSHAAAAIGHTVAPVDGGPIAVLETLAIIACGLFAGQRLRFPGGAPLVPLFLGTALQITGLVQITLPPWLLVAAYMLLGWQVGLRFTRDILAHAFRMLGQMFFSCFANVILAALSAWLLAWLLNIDGLTAYLATSPGGLDSIAVISLSINVDSSLVMALQTLRLIVVLLIGPWMAKSISRIAVAQGMLGRERGRP